MKRLTFTPDELAKSLDTLQHAGQIEGMFLSSGIIKGSVTTQDKIIDTAECVFSNDPPVKKRAQQDCSTLKSSFRSAPCVQE